MEPEWSRWSICSFDCSLQHTWMCSALWRCQSCQGESDGCCLYLPVSVCGCSFSSRWCFVCSYRHDLESDKGMGSWLKMLSYWLLKRARCAVMYDVKWMSKWGRWEWVRIQKLMRFAHLSSYISYTADSMVCCLLWCHETIYVLKHYEDKLHLFQI